MGIQYYWYFQYFQIGIGYWYFQYFWDFSPNLSIGIEYFHFSSSNTQYFSISENLIFSFKERKTKLLLNPDSNFSTAIFHLF